MPNAHNKDSPEVINRKLADIGETLTRAVDVEQYRSSSTIMRVFNSGQCQTDDDTESKCNTKATLRLTCNDKINGYETYHKINILEEDKRINQSFAKTKNQADIETADVYETIKCHTNKNQSKLLSNSPEINHIVSRVHNNIHHPQRTKIARGSITIPVEIILERI